MLKIYSNKIIFDDYDFSISSISKKLIIRASDIKSVSLKRWPPELVLKKNDEVIFLPKSVENDLELFCKINNIPTNNRLDVWSCISEEFLDTEHSEEEKSINIKRLEESGLSKEEVENIRKFTSYYTWEWVHLGHYDLLVAFGYGNNFLSKIKDILFYKKRKRFYDWCNKISARGIEITFGHDKDEEPISEQQQLENTIRYFLDFADFFDALAFSGGMKSKLSKEEIKSKFTNVIINSYNQPHRCYHNLKHLEQAIKIIRSSELPKNEKNAVELATWFHDIVYDPMADNNEEKSVENFLELIEGTRIKQETKETVISLIMFTKNHFEAKSDLEKLMFDADFVIFAQDWGSYNNYTNNVRKEYEHLDDEIFLKNRKQFLEKILGYIKDKGKLYFNLQPIYDEQAIKNIEKELTKIDVKLCKKIDNIEIILTYDGVPCGISSHGFKEEYFNKYYLENSKIYKKYSIYKSRNSKRIYFTVDDNDFLYEIEINTIKSTRITAIENEKSKFCNYLLYVTYINKDSQEIDIPLALEWRDRIELTKIENVLLNMTNLVNNPSLIANFYINSNPSFKNMHSFSFADDRENK